jgi:hypothetical protein
MLLLNLPIDLVGIAYDLDRRAYAFGRCAY